MKKVIVIASIFIISILLIVVSNIESEKNILNWNTCSVEWKFEENEFFKNVKEKERRIIFSTYENQYERYYYLENINGVSQKEILEINLYNKDVLDYNLDSKGNVYFIILEVANGKEIIYLKKLAVNGEIEILHELNPFYKGEEDDCYNWKIEVISDNKLLIYSNIGWWILDENGNLVTEKEWEKQSLLNIQYYQGNKVFAEYYDLGERQIILFDLETNEKRNLINVPQSIKFDFEVVSENTVYMYDKMSIYYYDTDNYRLLKKFDWSDYGIMGENLQTVYLDNGVLHAIIASETELSDVSWNITKNTEEKVELKLGCIGVPDSLRIAVSAFNASNEECRISIVDYSNEDEKIALNSLYGAILAGNGPDIIRFDSDYILDDQLLAEKDALEDLNKYLEKSEIINKENIVESLYDTISNNDKLFMLPTNFSIETMIAKKEWIKDISNKWTIGDILSIIENTNKDYELQISQDYLLCNYASYIVNQKEHNSIDENLLKEYLELALYLPKIAKYEVDDSKRREGLILLERFTISSMKDFLYKKSVWGEDSLYVGFPDVEGNGMAFKLMNCYGINSRSSNKDLAWKFIENFFKEEWQERVTPNYSFSANKDILHEQLYESTIINEYVDKDGKVKTVPLLTYVLNDELFEVYPANEKDVEEMMMLLEGVKVIRREAGDISKIVLDEATRYFNGDSDIDSVVKIIKNRLNILLEERYK